MPTALTLHNALYQGSLLSVLAESEWDAAARALQLPSLRLLAEAEGDLNMLRCAVNYIHSRQAGVGIAAVSNQ